MNYNAEIPIYLQVIHDLKKKMIQGKILPGEKLPSNRELAVLYKINQNTAARIYREMEKNNIRFQAKYKEIEENEVRFEEIHCEDAEYLIVAFGSMARIGQKAMEMAQKVLDKEDATEEEITEALKNLENAIGSLVKKEDTSSPSTDQDETTNQGADKNTSQNTDQKNDKNVVKTGDDSMVIPFVAAIAISVAAAAFIICRRMRRK